MSPRAAWRLEQLGYESFDYVAGKQGWLAHALPFEGEADLVVDHLDTEAPTCRLDEAADDVAGRVGEAESVVVLTDRDVVMGTADTDDLRSASPDATAADVMRFGVTTVRPAESVHELDHRMADAGADTVLVTRADGTFLGIHHRFADHQHDG